MQATHASPTPAGAGKTSSSAASINVVALHPRLRGEKTVKLVQG